MLSLSLNHELAFYSSSRTLPHRLNLVRPVHTDRIHDKVIWIRYNLAAANSVDVKMVPLRFTMLDLAISLIKYAVCQYPRGHITYRELYQL